MKILILIDDYIIESNKIAATMMHDLSVYIKSQNHFVTVVTPSSSIKEKFVKTSHQSVDIIRFKSGKIKNISFFKRAINESLLSYNCWVFLKSFFLNNKHDLIIYYSPSIFFGPLVYKLKKIWNSKSYLILRDIFPQWVIDNKLISKYSLPAFYFKFFEKINYKVADKIGLMSFKNLEWFNKKYNFYNKSEILFNWVNPNNKSEIISKINYRKLYKLDNKVIFFYGGNMGHAQDMMNIFRLIKNFRNKINAHFVLVGDGDEFEKLKCKIKNHKLKNVLLLKSISIDEYEKFLSEIDVGLITLNKKHSTHNFPGKILSYMKYSIPILGSINNGNDLKKIIHKIGGLISINKDDENFFLHACKLYDSKDLRLKYGKESKKILDAQFSVKESYNKIFKLVNK